MSARVLLAIVLFLHAAADELRWKPLLRFRADNLWPTPEPEQQDMLTSPPPTRDQDLLRCASQPLPEVINLQPRETSFFSRTGKWYGKQAYELVSWSQNRFRIDYLNVDYEVALKPWFTAQVLRIPEQELRDMSIFLPPPPKNLTGKVTTIVYKDCGLTPMYVSRQLGAYSQHFEVFNHLSQLVATGHPSKMVKGQLYFNDPSGLTFALAGSPTIAEAVGTSLERTYARSNDAYDFDPWQVWYTSGWTSVSYLKEPEHRWVIAAIVQEHSLLNTMKLDPSKATPYIAFLILCTVVCLGIVGMCLCTFVSIFKTVYPPRKQAPENPFMTMDVGGHPYGSFAARGERERERHSKRAVL
jgi:hypothetical protein